MDTFRLIYASAARLPSGQDFGIAIESILAPSRRNNEAVGVTGLLLHCDNVFIQVLEGDQTAVEAIYGRVAGDLRHERVRIITAERVANREFPQWTMCARTLRPADERILDVLGSETIEIATLTPDATLNLLCAVRQMGDVFRVAA